MADGKGIVHIPWYATGFRGDRFESAVRDISAISLRYGATFHQVYRYRDDRYKFLQVCAFHDKMDWTRYWDGPEFVDFRVNHSGWYQVPVLYAWTDLVAHGELAGAEQPVTSGPGYDPTTGPIG